MVQFSERLQAVFQFQTQLEEMVDLSSDLKNQFLL